MAKTVCDLVALRKARERIRFVHVRHEEAAAMAAYCYPKFARRLGACFSTAAPGAIHLLNGIYDAKRGAAPRDWRGRGGLAAVVALTALVIVDAFKPIGGHQPADRPNAMF